MGYWIFNSLDGANRSIPANAQSSEAPSQQLFDPLDRGYPKLVMDRQRGSRFSRGELDTLCDETASPTEKNNADNNEKMPELVH